MIRAQNGSEFMKAVREFLDALTFVVALLIVVVVIGITMFKPWKN